MSDRLFSYDSRGYLGQYTSATGDIFDYVMDGKDRLAGKKKNGTLQWRSLFTDNRRVATINSGGTLKHEYIHATNDLAPDYMIDGANKLRMIKDNLGTVRLVVNSSTGTVVQRLDYNEWGKVTSDTNPGYQPFGFAGGAYDPDTGFVKFGARDYDPETGRWTSKDPIGFDAGDMNLYGYVVNDPVNLVDPSGENSAPAVYLPEGGPHVSCQNCTPAVATRFGGVCLGLACQMAPTRMGKMLCGLGASAYLLGLETGAELSCDPKPEECPAEPPTIPLERLAH